MHVGRCLETEHEQSQTKGKDKTTATGIANQTVVPHENRASTNGLSVSRLRSALQAVYYHLTAQTNEQLHAAFSEDLFDSQAEYRRYAEEFESSRFAEIRSAAADRYQERTGNSGLGDVDSQTALDLYAIVRSKRPESIVETGVCNGISTLAVLLALDRNGTGHCYSVDFPYRINDSLEEFRDETFEGYGGAAIPDGEDPGWLIPDELRGRWTLRLGKSQIELPKLRAEIDSIDCFIHDSEHSAPCMTFEFELAWAWFDGEGVIIADDISWNDAFERFAAARAPISGRINRNVGYLLRESHG